MNTEDFIFSFPDEQQDSFEIKPISAHLHELDREYSNTPFHGPPRQRLGWPLKPKQPILQLSPNFGCDEPQPEIQTEPIQDSWKASPDLYSDPLKVDSETSQKSENLKITITWPTNQGFYASPEVIVNDDLGDNRVNEDGTSQKDGAQQIANRVGKKKWCLADDVKLWQSTILCLKAHSLELDDILATNNLSREAKTCITQIYEESGWASRKRKLMDRLWRIWYSKTLSTREMRKFKRLCKFYKNDDSIDFEAMAVEFPGKTPGFLTKLYNDQNP